MRYILTLSEVMNEVGIDMSDQYPKGLRTYMGKVGFNYSIIVCARAEKDCPRTFPGVGMRFVWIFDDPRGEDVAIEEMLEAFREVRDEIEAKILYWIEHPEEELREQRERERLLRQGLLRTHRVRGLSCPEDLISDLRRPWTSEQKRNQVRY